MLEKRSRTLTRTIALECYAGRHAERVLREMEGAYRDAVRRVKSFMELKREDKV